ncbi:hypothetical protein [Thalassomonas actiniarum]|uniref:Uncharacterized protein n=1 Tax=Thalassomonas actiniarum TaxID=485447 RepID=A0AAE9YUM9_9GAMM|nr:hypothetical protein [Thalassomonas actiniarum]WDE00739.1 hypothetical protein SG35_008960 [Thalassomonas actiniarum]
MENIITNTSVQGGLFNIATAKSLFYITNQRNLMSFLGAGMIVPAASQFRYKEDSRKEFNGAIPFWKKGIPTSSEYIDLVDDQRIVVIECNSAAIMKYCDGFIVDDNENVLVVNAAIPLSSISVIYMHTDDAIADFLVRLPEDVIAERSIFKILKDVSVIEHDIKLTPSEVENIAPYITFIDSFGGGIKALEQLAICDISNYEYILNLLIVCLDSYRLENVKVSVMNLPKQTFNISEADKEILHHLLPILQSFNIEDGFDPLYVLEKVEECFKNQIEGITEENEKWLVYIKRVIDADIEVPVLADEGDIFKRAVLLFLLRPDLERLKNALNSTISPGPVVFSIAVFLAGYTTGLCRMGGEYKGNYDTFNNFTKSLLDWLWCRTGLTLSTSLQPDTSGVSLVYKINKEVLMCLKLAPNSSLARVLHKVVASGYILNYDGDSNELYFNIQLNSGECQPLYIVFFKQLDAGFDAIRLVTPYLPLTGSKLKTLTKKMAIELLIRNSEESMYCNYSYSEKHKAIVIEAKLIINNIVNEEFDKILNYIVKMANFS